MALDNGDVVITDIRDHTRCKLRQTPLNVTQRGSTGLIPRRILKLTHQRAAPEGPEPVIHVCHVSL